jgi:hypothetical protein
VSTKSSEERFSRQVILPGVGLEGQAKWAQASILLAGEGPALEAAALGLASSGVAKLHFVTPGHFDSFSLTSNFPQLQVDVHPEDSDHLPDVSLSLVLSEKAAFRRKMSRLLRHLAKPALFGWPAASGFALMAAKHTGGQCPCMECFEVMNPKAFGQGDGTLWQMLGAAAASEALLWILKGNSPLEGKVWVNSLGAGLSIHHEVRPTYKCAARLMEEGATITP